MHFGVVSEAFLRKAFLLSKVAKAISKV